jgi:membrane protein DedA with SNARE-associated domain
VADDFTERYRDLLTGWYDCADRIVVNAYYPLGSTAGGFRTWWRRLSGGSDAEADAVLFDEAKLKVGRLIFDRHGGKVVFFGRFVSILRTYAAFLAGVNGMHYRPFLAFNAAGGALWSGVYAAGFYYAGSTFTKLRGPTDVALGVAAALIVVAFVIWTRRHFRRLEGEAEAAYPGSLREP